jgi:phage FluMu protein Com
MRKEIDMEDLRCLCGSLVAKVKKQGIEFKCRRCKRVALIPFSGREQALLEKNHPEVFRYEITFDHPHADPWSRPEAAEGLGGSR